MCNRIHFTKIGILGGSKGDDLRRVLRNVSFIPKLVSALPQVKVATRVCRASMIVHSPILLIRWEIIHMQHSVIVGLGGRGGGSLMATAIAGPVPAVFFLWAYLNSLSYETPV
jgi:hypothetical protein